MIRAGFCRRSRSNFLISRVASIPSMTGIEMFIPQLGPTIAFIAFKMGPLTHEHNVIRFSGVLESLHCQQAVSCCLVLVVVLPYECSEKLCQMSVLKPMITDGESIPVD